tara:strand:- start:1197 stop:1541 length:345 start_codon:yes stop_codon:yes gene_type:complete
MPTTVNQNEYPVTTTPDATFTTQSPSSISYAETSSTELTFMPVTFDTTTYSGQTSTALSFSGLTSTSLSYIEQESTTLTYEEFSKIDGSPYGSGVYSGENDYYAGRPFVMGRIE